MPIAELFLSSVVKTLLNQLSSTLLEEYARINGISGKLQKWGTTLRMIQALMDSAEEKQMDGDLAVNQWLAELREVAYDMEDLLDEFAVEAKRNASMSQTLSGKLPSCLITCCSRIDPRTLWSDHRMASEIEDVDRRLEIVFQHKSNLSLVENCNRPPANPRHPPFATTSLPVPKFVGREKQTEELLARLTGIEETHSSVPPCTVVSIVGMGGLGKTTLAQELYNHESVRKVFEVRAWTCVSDVFDRVAITKSVLDQVASSSSSEGKDLNWLQNSLKEQLFGKKFLIVLDDVWNDNYGELESLLNPLSSGSKESRILLTTRNLEVAKKAGDRDPRELNLLSLGECLSLLAYHSIGEENFERHSHLQDIAVKLAEKCKGLPLAAKTIGGLLHFESNDEKWKQVLAHDIWDREGGHGKIPAALKLSYVHLPIHLKRCFAACALFPKDYLFDGDELIQLWIVQGLLHKETFETYRDVGMNHLSLLEARSLLQKARGEKTRYSMHDLINDLAKSVVGDTYFSSDEYRGPSSEESLAKVRHAAMVTQSYERCIARRFHVYRSMKKLRTFMPFHVPMATSSGVYVSNKVIHDLIIDLKRLRMLSLRYFQISTVPDQIGELKLLRSIDFSHTNIEVLPESICDLVELKSLLLHGCRQLKKLPRNIHKLTKLLHLDLTDTYNLEEMPPRMDDLTNLEILPKFVVGKEVGQKLSQLGPLKCLQRDLNIHNLLEVDDVGDARIANLHAKEGVFELSFNWGRSFEISSNDEHQLKLLDHLQPPGKIEYLSITYYGGKKFPSWFGNLCMNNIVSITLRDCKRVESLPHFGQLPLLESLNIRGLEAVSTIGAEFYGAKTPFRSLMSLSFMNMGAWETWSSHGDYENDQPFPCLHELTVIKCPKLKGGLPGRLETLFKLEISQCPLMETSGDTLSLPSLGEMNIQSCNEGLLKCLVDVTCMTKMTIRNVPQLVHFDGRFSTSWVALEEIKIEGCSRLSSLLDGDGGKQLLPKLKKLEISDCENIEKLSDDLYCLTSLNEITVRRCPKLFIDGDGGKQVPPKLKKLEISDCEDIEKLSDDLYCLTSLNELTVRHCRKLFIDGDGGKKVPPKLKKLEISNCEDIEKLPDDLYCLTSLNEMTVRDCRKLSSFPSAGLPPALRKLKVVRCPSLPQCQLISTRLPESLEELGLYDLEGLTSITDAVVGTRLSRSLRELSITGCQNLTTLPDSLRNLSALSVLRVWGCQALEVDCFPALPCNLSKFRLSNCPKVKSLPNDMHNLTSLKVLKIRYCDGITCLPRGGLPPKLERLGIRKCRNLNQPLEEWGLRWLTALEDLKLVGEIGCLDEMVRFPSSSAGESDAWDRCLPSYLLKLRILRMKKLERVDSRLRAHLASLQMLVIEICPKMRRLPNDGLPDTLTSLTIGGCPLLEERCSEPNGVYWPLIQLLPQIRRSVWIPVFSNEVVPGAPWRIYVTNVTRFVKKILYVCT